MRRLVSSMVVLGALALGHAGGAAAWSWPTGGGVLRPFALGGDPYAGGQHRGVDVAARDGDPVVAPVAGRITFAGSVPTHGRTVAVLTADGLSVTLSHLGPLRVARGATVAEGDVVATVGVSGVAEQSVPYVHLGVRVASQDEGYLDPLRFLPASGAAAPAPPAAPGPGPGPAPAPGPEPPSSVLPHQSPPGGHDVGRQEGPVDGVAEASAGPTTAATPASSDAPAATYAVQDEAEVQAGSPATEAAGGRAGGVRPVSPARPAGAGRPGDTSLPPPRDRSPAVRPPTAPVAKSPITAAPVVETARTLGASHLTSASATSPAGPGRASGAHGPRRTVVTGDGDGPPVRRWRAAGAGAMLERGPAMSGAPVASASGDVGRSAAGGRGAEHRTGGAAALLARDILGRPAWVWLGALLTAAVTALILVAARAATRTARRTIGRDGAVLRDNTDLLRQLDAAHRPRVHDDRGRRLRAAPASARA